MATDLLEKLLHEVSLGKISIKDAKKALEGVDLEKEDFQRAVDHGVFTPAEPGTIVKATISPSGGSALVSLLFIWGIFWVTYWTGTMAYGLMNGWDQQQLSYHLFLSLSTIIIMAIVYQKWVLPDLIVIKHERNKFIPEHSKRKHEKDWYEYKV
ncbi:MAG: hypothetical protein VX613_06080 [Candidatus Thermoplasmatota archaeon]|nr:hypothetical protein [Candidatus Thermoplasmatota archaeon]CAI8258056.1 MAG: Uncharacterised protein [Euryarchaeota archaeon]|tara:strand:+ start:1122 stop:1583 length:462 start_codon:yes stop_codon:yes gene_type:complete